jgi:hypothetical protein
MGRKNRPKRKTKHKAGRGRRRPGRVSLAYRGNKYKTEALVGVHFHVELGIYEAFVMAGRSFTDHTVASALEKLILRMQRGPLPDLGVTSTARYVEGEDADFIIWNIRRNLQHLFQTEPRPSRDTLIGVLRTILGSVELWSSASPQSRGYLRFVEGFLQDAGVSLEVLPPDAVPLGEPEEDDLLPVGRAWCHEDDPEAAAEFRARAEHMCRSGQAERVLEVCQQLLGAAPEMHVVAELSAISLRAHQSVHTSMG